MPDFHNIQWSHKVLPGIWVSRLVWIIGTILNQRMETSFLFTIDSNPKEEIKK